MNLDSIITYQSDSVMLMILTAMVLGIYCAWICRICFQSSKGMAITVSMLPVVVCAALIAINGSLGTGIAILGVFGLVRFRSLPGKSTDIITVFYAMTAGLIVSTGHILSAILITVLLGIFFWLIIIGFDHFFREPYTLVILAPEEEANAEQFEEILKRDRIRYNFESVRTSHMGTLYEFTFIIHPGKNFNPVPLMDEIRVCNGNLNVTCRKGASEASL